MPFDAPQSLTPDEVYSVTAWLLHQNGIITENAVIDSATLPAVQMPNRHGFVPDPRPDVQGPKYGASNPRRRRLAPTIASYDHSNWRDP